MKNGQNSESVSRKQAKLNLNPILLYGREKMKTLSIPVGTARIAHPHPMLELAFLSASSAL